MAEQCAAAVGMVSLEGDRSKTAYFALFGAQAVYLLDNSSGAGVLSLGDATQRRASVGRVLRWVVRRRGDELHGQVRWTGF